MVSLTSTSADMDGSGFRYLTSGVDDSGRVFTLDRTIYRALTPKGKSVFDHLTRSGALEKLVDVGLVGSEFCDMSFEDYPLVLKHQRLPLVSYCQEWPFEMLRQAALLQCVLTRELISLGLVTKDAHPWNVTFDFTRPVFLDFGSIAWAEEVFVPNWMAEFRTHFYTPLWLAAHKQFSLARWCMKEHPSGPIKKILSNRVLRKAQLSFARLALKARKRGFAYFLDGLTEHLHSLEVMPPKEDWSHYGQAQWKAELVGEILSGLEAHSLIDLGANKGAFSNLAEDLGLSVVALDLDEYSMDRLYRQASVSQECILPLVVDLLRPTPPFGIGLYYESSCHRLRCDIAMALAIIHHLVFKANVQFETVAAIVNRYVNRYALVEFIPDTDEYVSKWLKGREQEFAWYNENEFVDAFMAHFNSVKKWNSPTNTRVLFLFER